MTIEADYAGLNVLNLMCRLCASADRIFFCWPSTFAPGLRADPAVALPVGSGDL